MEPDIFLGFLRYCIDEQQPLSIDIEKMDWEGLYKFASHQTITAIVFDGVERLKNDAVRIPRNLLLSWFAESEQIKQQNRFVYHRCVEIVELLRKDGFGSCVLKGQGNAAMYPNPFLRTPGDIDVWVKPLQESEGGDNGFIRKVIAYAKIKNPGGNANIIHVDYGVFGGVEVELHYWPTYMNSPINNKRLQHWVRQQVENVFNNKKIMPDGGVINVPTAEFNIVYQLSHMFKHVISEGLGLKQVIDYYYLLKYNSETNLNSIISTLRTLGLMKFAGAIMYILHNVLGLEEKYLIVPIDKRRGVFLYEEIIRGGNFGKYDTGNLRFTCDNSVGSLLRHVERDFRLIRYFPSESLWEPVSRIYQHYWRKRYN